MGMPVEFNTLIVTKGNEKRVEANLFVLQKNGFRIYPINIPIEVKKTLDSDASGQAIVKKIIWESDYTELHYELITLHSSN